ncbi:hypothetical protein BZB76_6159 [Actinomadura pelletieri DSM 43383]|uniref:Uncharacterized protein n=1 Tax=Actinomadura pelletieri DSM 43383 TaxID=1120940 RepID=A0A495QBG7_9ACTN|nr:hypothetical protein [Actinomadura pelletieri]RKS69020.1 hypothetical protein BZB76_6159 [Actinomadura pelletieri DSM 43383]
MRHTGCADRPDRAGDRVRRGGHRYEVTWDGPVRGRRTVSATSATLGEVSTNGSHTFTVVAVDGAGTGPKATRAGRPTGPATRHPVERNGESTGHVRSAADANGSTIVPP